MAEEKKKPEEEKAEEKSTEQTPDTPSEQKAEPSKEEPKAEGEETKPDNKPSDENSEGEKPEEKAKEKPEQQTEETAEPAPPQMSEEDRLKEENFRLKTQLEAMKIGFSPEVIEDAVVLAENIVKKDGSDITAALQAVAKKYPDWKADSKNGKSKGGFKVGADTSGSKPTSDEKLNRAFGIKK